MSVRLLSPTKITLITGHTNSGKSEWAEFLASRYKSVTYFATSESNYDDNSWNEKVKKHSERRPKDWNLIESSEHFIDKFKKINHLDLVLIDSLGGFVTHYLSLNETDWISLQKVFIDTLQKHPSPVLIVIEQVGWSVVPFTEIGILFTDRLSALASKLQLISTQSWLVINRRAININSIGYQVP